MNEEGSKIDGSHIGRSVKTGRDFIGRDQVSIDQLIIQIYQSATPLELTEAALAELRDAYLAYLRELCQTLDFKGIRLPEAVEKTVGLSLRDVYVPVRARRDLPEGETWQRIAGRYWKGDEAVEFEELCLESKAGQVNLETIIQNHPALVVLGDPGAGKSTLLKHLALGLATANTGALPILVPLNAYGKALQEWGALSLSDFLPHYFAGRQQRLQGLGPLFQAALAQGKAVVLLDGLDEVVAERGKVVALLDDFVREHLPLPSERTSPKVSNRFIATSRFVGYREAPLTHQRWNTVALVDWEMEEIRQFVERFTLAVETLIAGGETETARQQAAAERDSLLNSIAHHEGIRRLAGNPLLLTILVLIKRQGVELPERRVELYELYLETLLRSWNKARALDRTPVGPEVDYHEIWQILAPMALWLRATNPQAGLVTERQLNEFLVTYYQDEEDCPRTEARRKTQDFLEAVHRYSSLLLERGRGQYGFIHQTLEEYLAGCGLTLLPKDKALRLILTHLDEPHWRETLLLGIGALGIVRKAPREAGVLLEDLLAAEMPSQSRGNNLLLAGEALRDVGRTGIGARTAQRITTALVETLQDAAVEPRRRREAGLILEDIGWQPEDLDTFVMVEPATFLYGDEKKPHRLDYRYWIARYPVTNHQYARFLEETARDKPTYWTKRDFNNPLSPVVGVSWDDAQAYCRWLDEKISTDGFQVASLDGRLPLPKGYKVRLPAEEEWERAARGTDGRDYPWPGEFDGNRANTWESGIGSTAAVCTYPLGMSPVGAWDMAGNVWEWTVSEEGEYRVVRGGSWVIEQRHARCACRVCPHPDYFGDLLGFRVVVSLANSELEVPKTKCLF
jgi:formylglycine-generating enzyme required for sulfatase activity